MSEEKNTSLPGVDTRTLAARLDEELVPTTPNAQRRSMMKQRILDHVNGTTIKGSHTVRANDGIWEPFLPGIEKKQLYRDAINRRESFLLRMSPGSVLPRHEHAQAEQCLILEGELQCGDILLGAGDYHMICEGNPHPDITSPNGATFMIHAGL